MRPRTTASEIRKRDSEFRHHGWPPEIEHGQLGRVDPPQPPALAGRIDGPARGRLPLRPGRRRLERRVQRPRLAGAVIAALRGGRPIRREGRRVQAGLPVNPPAEPADRVQT
jgi:hypothetical protein